MTCHFNALIVLNCPKGIILLSTPAFLVTFMMYTCVCACVCICVCVCVCERTQHCVEVVYMWWKSGLCVSAMVYDG